MNYFNVITSVKVVNDIYLENAIYIPRTHRDMNWMFLVCFVINVIWKWICFAQHFDTYILRMLYNPSKAKRSIYRMRLCDSLLRNKTKKMHLMLAMGLLKKKDSLMVWLGSKVCGRVFSSIWQLFYPDAWQLLLYLLNSALLKSILGVLW